MKNLKKKILALITATICLIGMFPASSFATNYWQCWTDGGGQVIYTDGGGGNYAVSWTNCGNFVAGKGWKPGSRNRIVYYNCGAWQPSGNAYLTFYGWTKNKLVEYYVVDSWGSWRPPGAASKGTYYVDDGTYEVFQTWRQSAPSIIGTASFDQYWSVRTTKRPTGNNVTLNFPRHVQEWENRGMYLGSQWDYQIMAVEGYQSSGYANLTVW